VFDLKKFMHHKKDYELKEKSPKIVKTRAVPKEIHLGNRGRSSASNVQESHGQGTPGLRKKLGKGGH